MSSINNLATEILISILERVVDPSEWTLDHLRTLALVSRYFLSIVASTPSLWAVARFGAPTSSCLEHIDLALLKSKEAPLVVILEHDTAMAQTDITTFMIKVVPHSRRWRVANFHNQHTQLIAIHLADLVVPMLESFAYHQEIANQFEPRVFALGGMNMRHLTLKRVSAMGTAQLCGLKTLSLCVLPQQFQISTTEIITIISQFLLLEKLSLNTVDTVGEHDISPASLSPIVLQHLHTLDIRFVSSALLVALMTRIEANYVICLHVATISAEGSLELLRLLAENETTMARLLLSVHFYNGFDGIAIKETADIFVLGRPRSDRRAGSLIIHLPGVSLSVACHCLSTILPRLPLDISIAKDTAYPLQILEHTHRITSLTIDEGAGRNILAYLAGPPDSDGPPNWRCPRLKIVRLSESAYDGSDTLLVEFLTQRYKHLEFAELGMGGARRGSLMHVVILSDRVIPRHSAIILATRKGLPGTLVEVEALDFETYVFMSKWPPRKAVVGPRPQTAIFAIPTFLSVVIFAAVVFFLQ
ncbi:hypothetical protein FRB95_012143 [Tulasnella sp. JGI-2019a]|nr:hypothetical protein FRB95_012143 [Tulasnella sp. JGI-2019a]